MRSPHFSAGSPIETHTSVWTKSQPATPRSGSSVSRIAGAGLPRQRVRPVHDLVRRPQRPGRRQAHVHAHPRAHQEQRVAHVVARVAEVAVRDLLQRLASACSSIVSRSASICVGCDSSVRPL